ncbi:hypothetical protein [Methanobrevibacter sp.]|uniref:hypothetical protein n=1 Tax=Methanobrevibacter sp. TaxID=66852 RepID=UPI00388FBDB1
MTSYYVCADNIDGRENSRINALMEAMKKKGHSATSGGVGPNTVQSKGLSSSSSGMVGVFIVGGSDAGMYVDFRDGLKRGYYHYKHMKVVFASETATTDKWITCNGLANTPLVRAHDDNYSGSNIDAVGQTAKAFFDANKQYISYACGKKGCTFQDVINNFFSGSEDGSGDDSEGGTSSTLKEALKKAVSGWDGEVEINLREDTVYVNKIHDPTETKLLINEFDNVIFDSVTTTDLNPQTPNKIIMNYQGQELSLKDEISIKRFGEIPFTVMPDEFVKSYEDAIAYLQRVWNKIRRDDARQVELKVNGDFSWKTGLWARTFLPSFFIDDYMYIIRTSDEEDSSGNWTTNLTLVDYPPSFGVEEEEPEEEDEESDEDVEE